MIHGLCKLPNSSNTQSASAGGVTSFVRLTNSAAENGMIAGTFSGERLSPGGRAD
jgi:hypothetical protein